MLAEPECFKRQCVYFRGVTWLGRQESSEVNFCNAFSADVGGIPEDIAYGDNLHLRPKKGQGNDITFEKILELSEV